MGRLIAIDKLYMNKIPNSCKECPLTYLDTGDDAYFGANERRCVIDDSCIDGMVSERAYDCPLVEAIPKDEVRKLLRDNAEKVSDSVLDIVKEEYIPKSQYENRLKAEHEKIAEDVADKMDYMGSCLNEKNIILGVITGKRETLDSLCSTCKSESCVSNGTAISKADYENRLKADMIAILTEIQLEIEEEKTNTEHLHYDELEQAENYNNGVDNCSDIIQHKINALKADKED